MPENKSFEYDVPIDIRQIRAISVRVHKCDLCEDQLTNVSDNIESHIDMLQEIDDSYLSEYDKQEPRLLLCGYCKKGYLLPSYT